MSTNSNIEWTEATWNPVTGCTRVNADCDHCYAVPMTHRLGEMGQSKYVGLTVLNPKGDRHFNGTVKCHEDAIGIPLGWRKPRRVFVNSMGDLFHKSVPDAFIRRVFAVMSLCGQHTFQVLTKRPDRMAAFFANEENNLSACQAEYTVGDTDWRTPTGKSRIRDSRAINGTRKGLGDGNYWPLPNVWLGTSCGHQAADAMAQHLLKCPAKVRFLSCEPLWGPVDLSGCMTPARKIMGLGGPYVAGPDSGVHWVVVGGESGPGARPCDVAWIRSIVTQCKAAGVPCFVKQLGSHVVCPNDHVSDWNDDVPSLQIEWPRGVTRYQGELVRVRLNDRKGGDMAEWPEDLRVRELPA